MTIALFVRARSIRDHVLQAGLSQKTGDDLIYSLSGKGKLTCRVFCLRPRSRGLYDPFTHDRLVIDPMNLSGDTPQDEK